jgi:hypothetical protein
MPITLPCSAEFVVLSSASFSLLTKSTSKKQARNLFNLITDPDRATRDEDSRVGVGHIEGRKLKWLVVAIDLTVVPIAVIVVTSLC